MVGAPREAGRRTVRHDSGAFGKKYLPETMGAGGAFFDADGDGAQDLLFVNSMSWPGRPAKKSLLALYKNNRDGTFTDVTAASGLGVQTYGMGVAAGDYDNDGRTTSTSPRSAATACSTISAAFASRT